MTATSPEAVFPFAMKAADAILAQVPTLLGKQPAGLDLAMIVLPGLSYYLVNAKTCTLVWGTC